VILFLLSGTTLAQSDDGTFGEPCARDLPALETALLAASVDTDRLSLSRDENVRVTRVVRALRKGRHNVARNRWSLFVTSRVQRGIPMDVNALVQSVLRESYMENNKDLRFYADKVRFFNDLKRGISHQLTSARELQAGAPPDGEGGDLDATIKDLEQQLSTVGDDAQLANIDLQNALQKQQQVLQTMSNISKMLHDTMMAVIRKIG
jgi:hypothetical protein